MPTQLFTSANAGSFAEKRWEKKNDASQRVYENKLWEIAGEARTEQCENNHNSLVQFMHCA